MICDASLSVCLFVCDLSLPANQLKKIVVTPEPRPVGARTVRVHAYSVEYPAVGKMANTMVYNRGKPDGSKLGASSVQHPKVYTSKRTEPWVNPAFSTTLYRPKPVTKDIS